MAHGYCQFGRNFSNLSEVKISSNLSMASMSFTMDRMDMETSQPNHPSVNPYPAPFLEPMGQPSGPLAPCYMIPSFKCNHCNSMDPKSRVLSYVNEAQTAYHGGASKWNF